MIPNTSSSTSSIAVKRVYVIFPRSNTIVLEAFNPILDIIDVTRIPLLRSREDLSYVAPPLSFSISASGTSYQQKVLFPHITSFDQMPDHCFLYASSESSSSVVQGGLAMLLEPSVLIPVAALISCVVLTFLFNLLQVRQKENDKDKEKDEIVFMRPSQQERSDDVICPSTISSDVNPNGYNDDDGEMSFRLSELSDVLSDDFNEGEHILLVEDNVSQSVMVSDYSFSVLSTSLSEEGIIATSATTSALPLETL